MKTSKPNTRRALRKVSTHSPEGHSAYANQKEIRAAFWEAHPQFASDFRVKKRQNAYRADIRMAFVDFVDGLAKSGELSQALADRVTL